MGPLRIVDAHPIFYGLYPTVFQGDVKSALHVAVLTKGKQSFFALFTHGLDAEKQEVTQMVEKRKKHIKKKQVSKGFSDNGSEAKKIAVSKAYRPYSERLSPFGGLLEFIKLFDLINFAKVFHHPWIEPHPKPSKVGDYLTG